jgi:hypothetical protein
MLTALVVLWFAITGPQALAVDSLPECATG